MRRRPPKLRPDPARAKPFIERRAERLPIEEQARLARGSWYEIEVRVRDVSASGFMAECEESVEIGSTVSLDVPGIGAVEAQVRWQIGSRMGGMFRDPISLAQCEWVATRAEELRASA